MYYDELYESALDAGVELISKPAPGLLTATVYADDRDAMQKAAAEVQALLRAPLRDDASLRSLCTAIDKLLDRAFSCAGDTALSVVDGLCALWGDLEVYLEADKLTRTLVLPDLNVLESGLCALVNNTIKLETERERDARHAQGFLTAEEWQWERDERDTRRRLDAQFSADNAADYNATRYW